MRLYQISYVNGKTSYSLLPIKQKVTKSAPEVHLNEQSLTCEECGLKFATEVRLKWHQSTHNPLKNCKNSRRQAKIMKQQDDPLGETVEKKVTDKCEEQLKEGKKNLIYICPSCDFRTTNRSTMISHFTGTHYFKAKDQPHDAEEAELLQQPKMEIDEENHEIVEEKVETLEITCAQCGFSSFNQDDIDFHTCHDPEQSQMFSCHLCTYECLTRMGLQSHITRKHKPKAETGQPRVFQCDFCEFKCSNKNTLYSHRRKHRRDDDKPVTEGEAELDCSYFCNECDFSTKKKGALYLHIQRRHKSAEEKQQVPSRPEYYSCDQCDYTNKNKYEMKVHVIRKHTNEYNHECEICGKKYKIRGDLTNHIRFQHREQPIICDVCGKTCGNSNSLYVHQKFAHYKAEFECPICHRRMVSQANLDEHILKQHEQREDAVCEECGKTFTRQSRLKIHMRIHTGVKPHSCKICAKAFTRKTALRQHLLIHTGQRPYVCDICGKAFTQKPGLISHRKSHPGSHPPLPRVTIDHVLSELLTEES